MLWRERNLAQPIVVRNANEAAPAGFFGFCDLDQIDPPEAADPK
jgi:hypothetical protein